MEEHRITPETGNVITNAFAFIVTILTTIILADLLRAVVRNLSLTPSVPTANDVALTILTVAILLEALVAAFDNYAYTRERYDPLHRGIVKFEIVRHLITFFSIIVLFLGVRSVTDVWQGSATLSTAAAVVTSVILIRYLSEGLWQYSAKIRRYYLRLRVDWTATPADGNDPFTDEACRTIWGSEDSLVSYATLIVISGLGLALVLYSSSVAIDALLAGGVVFSTEYVYIKLWADYYTDLLNIDEPLVDREKIEEEKNDSSLKEEEEDEAVRSAFVNLVDDEEVSPERLARELKVYHEDPRYKFTIGEDGEGVTEILELIQQEDVDSEQLVEEFCLPIHQTEEADIEGS